MSGVIGFYEALGPYYDDLFPVDPETVRFLERQVPAGRRRPAGRKASARQAASFLDVACGTGGYTLALARHGLRGTGVDLDEGLLERARKKHRQEHPEAQADFLRGDMLEVPALCPGPWDLVFCIGNSLVHLDGEAAIGRALEGFRDVLAPGGRLVVQIINYDRVLEQRVSALPELAPPGAPVRLVREYRWDPGDCRVEFAAELVVSGASGETRVRSSVPLFILRAGTLRGLAEAAGFREIDLFGDFRGGPWSGASFLTVLSARKG